MEQFSPVLAILSHEDDRAVAGRLANLLGYSYCHIAMGTAFEAAHYIEANQISPSYIAFFIGSRRDEIMQELAHLSQYCLPGTRVVVIGETNDIRFYRELMDRGVVEYFTTPVDIEAVSKSLFTQSVSAQTGNSWVISSMSAAAGDGSSTVAINTAYSLAKEFNAKTIVVDMDYQFGMISKNLDLSSPFGIKELFEHPDRGIDSTLLERMAIGYNSNLDIIAAPNELKFQPDLRPEIIRDLILALQEKYQYIVIDLPHIWSPWIAAAFNNSDNIMLVAQLWLKSVTHASRLLNVWREIGININNVDVVINRSGAKYKEGVTQRDFERVCNKSISYLLSNDIKTVVNAENGGKTVMELGKSKLSSEFLAIATQIRNRRENENPSASNAPEGFLSGGLRKRV